MNDPNNPIETEAAALAAPFEGFRSKPYRDSTGKWTIGYGCTVINGHPVSATTPAISESMGRLLLSGDMAEAVRVVQADVHVPLTADQSAALADFVYNLGEGAFKASNVLRDLNARNYAAAAKDLEQWDHAGGKVLAGLLRRRESEEALFNKKEPA